jgi:phage nucleotide-binding protein
MIEQAATTTAIDRAVELREALQVKPPGEIIMFLNALVYGEAGVGKTYLGGTADDDPRMSPVLFVDVEGGLATIRERKSIDVVTVRNMKQVEELYNRLYHSIENNSIYYKTVVIDSLTELADLDMRVVMKDSYQRNPDKVDVDVPSPREWGKVRNHIRLIVRAFRDLPCHVLYTAHVGTLAEEGQPTKFFPGFAGKLGKEVPGFMDVVGYMYSENKEGVIYRYMQVQGTRRVVAKDRTDTLGDVVENPSLPTMWDVINNGERISDKGDKS